jgi:hypothetical protein
MQSTALERRMRSGALGGFEAQHLPREVLIPEPNRRLPVKAGLFERTT